MTPTRMRSRAPAHRKARHGSASPRTETTTMDRTDHARLPMVAETCIDEAEVLALSVTRFIAAGYMTGDVACWDAGHACAEEMLGPAEGPRLVAVMASIMRALRAEREAPWQFLPATCCRVIMTRDEVSLIQAFGLARRGEHDALTVACAMLAGRPTAPHLAAALVIAAERLDALQSLLGCADPPRAAEHSTLH